MALTHPSDYLPAKYGRSHCDVCDAPMKYPADDSYRCEQFGCNNTELCIGCVFDCHVCGEDFCREHITLTPTGYVCQGCAGERSAQAA